MIHRTLLASLVTGTFLQLKEMIGKGLKRKSSNNFSNHSCNINNDIMLYHTLYTISNSILLSTGLCYLLI